MMPYLDNAATTPCDPRVTEAMLAVLTSESLFGNAGSNTHRYGFLAQEQVTRAREQVAALLCVDARDIVFTSGATEADNLAIKGVAAHYPRGHIVTSAIEHHAVLDTCRALEDGGYRVTYVPPLANGQVSPQAIAGAITADTFLVSIMQANNETGVVNDLPTIATLCQSRGVALHTDATQAFGKCPLNVRTLPVDLVSVSAHKMYGPKGVGALYVRRRAGMALAAQIHGGNQEQGRRSGTLPTHQIVGFGEACRLAQTEGDEDNARICVLRDRLADGLLTQKGVCVNGSANKLPGHLNVAVSGVNGSLLLSALTPQLAVSNGSACTSASMAPSHVLTAMGLDDDLAHASVRFSLGRFTQPSDVDQAINVFTRVVERLRA